MGKCLVIGSTVCDVMIYLDQLPGRQGDTHIRKQVMSLGGCAFNVVTILHHLGVDYDFISPVGSGLYGTFVKSELKKLGIETSIALDGENGCCYCFVESDGERTFLSDHGVEYSFDPAWLEGLDLSSYEYIYVCGLELEEETGQLLVDSLTDCPIPIIFAPGPRGNKIASERMQQLLDLSPILHVNEQESIDLTHEVDVEKATIQLFNRTGRAVIVTRGKNGAIAFDGGWHKVASFPATVKDTIGAGDSHVGALMAALAIGKNLTQGLKFANLVSSYIVSQEGVHLEEIQYKELKERLTNIGEWEWERTRQSKKSSSTSLYF